MAIRFYLDNRPNKVGEHPIRVSESIRGAKFQALLTSGLKRIGSKTSPGRHTTLFTHLDRFISEESLTGQWAYSTIRCWKTFRGHLLKFNPDISYENFDEDGINYFLNFLRYEQNLSEKTVKKIHTYLKWFLNWSIRKRLTSEATIKTYRPKFKVLERPVIFLTKEELMKLYHYSIPPSGTVVTLLDFEGHPYSKRIICSSSLEKTRDLFCFCAFTSLRYSDMAKVRRTDIRGNYLYVTTLKTNDRIPIDLNAFAKEILAKYKDEDFPDGLALPVISNQRMNRHIKELCELCGFNEPITRVYFRAGERICETKAKWQMVGTHAGRRTFICFALSSGIPPQVVMKWTGHADYKTMRPYIDVAEKTKSEAMKVFEEAMKR
jgi:integrase